MMNEHGKSDNPIVPGKLPNKADMAAEAVEGRGLAKGNRSGQNRLRTQGRAGVQSALGRIRQVTQKEGRQPSKRSHVPKPDGRKRPIGVLALEDKIAQRAVVMVLNAIYEHDFIGFSYGFRPGRNQHNALDALYVGITKRKVNWVLDADVREFFDSLSHKWLDKFVRHRIADRRILRLIQKWLVYDSSQNNRQKA